MLDEKLFENSDPDSSLYAWNNVYKKIYTENDWNFWKVFDLKNLKKENNRLLAVNIESLEYPQFNEWIGEIKIGGETDFNFKSGCKTNQKYEYYCKLIVDEETFTKEEKDLYLKKLNEYRDNKHHSLENFSLMLVTGSLNNVKGSLAQDRIDKFIYILNDYFLLRNIKEFEHIIFSKAIAKNKDEVTKRNNTLKLKRILYEYLNLFADIYDYCFKIYKITDKKLVDDLIESGKNPIKDGKDVVRYMELAERYWDMKKKLIDSRE